MKKKPYYAIKIKKAAHLLFFKHHKRPGLKGWELRRNLGSDYPKVLNILNARLNSLDLQVTTTFEGAEPEGQPTRGQLDKARFYITSKNGMLPEEMKLLGWRIDDIAGLATTIIYILSQKGKAPREEVTKLLRNKLPEWRVHLNLQQYIRYGYLAEDEKNQLYLDWRTRAEIDQKALVNLILTQDSLQST